MNYGCLIFLGVFATFLASWWGMVFAPQLQIGSQQPKTPEGATLAYPANSPGIAAQGHAVYVANGCVYCHSQQVRQEGYNFDVVLGSTTNQQDTVKALASLGLAPNEVSRLASTANDSTPQPVVQGVDLKEAARVQKVLTDAGATANTIFIPLGADMRRGWGARQSVAQDYLYEYPTQIGNSRLGPDLANVGTRAPDANTLLIHLYNPRATVRDSMMPAYQFLFEKRKAGRQPAPDALKMPPGFAPPAEYEIVPKAEAAQLVAYRQNLKVSTPLFEAPMTVMPQAAPAGTNAPAATNAPAPATTPATAK